MTRIREPPLEFSASTAAKSLRTARGTMPSRERGVPAMSTCGAFPFAAGRFCPSPSAHRQTLSRESHESPRPPIYRSRTAGRMPPVHSHRQTQPQSQHPLRTTRDRPCSAPGERTKAQPAARSTCRLELSVAEEAAGHERTHGRASRERRGYLP
eukprot:scaffold23366_cov112-Isochrysis_galbana.AAC.10